MALNWLWKDKCGEATVEFIDHEGETKQRTVNLYEGNAFLIFIDEWKDENGVGRYSLMTFWADKVHMKRCLGLDRKWETYGKNIYAEGYSKIVGIRLNKAKCRHYKDIVSAMVQAFDNIVIAVYTEKGEE